jgi:hypothetical protein
MRKAGIVSAIVGVATIVTIYFNVSLFVIQPIGAAPAGQTLVLLRKGKMNFIDSADAICERINGGVSLLCRGLVLGNVARDSKILFRLPYSSTLYKISTDNKTYSK